MRRYSMILVLIVNWRWAFLFYWYRYVPIIIPVYTVYIKVCRREKKREKMVNDYEMMCPLLLCFVKKQKKEEEEEEEKV
jgi:hypothetical protein